MDVNLFDSENGMNSQIKCDECDKEAIWYYEAKKYFGSYCDAHLPCGKIKRFMGKWIITILIPFL